MGGIIAQISISLAFMNSRFNHFLLVLALILTSIFLTNCGKNLETFTNGTKSNYDLDSNDIAYIQFYIDPGIRLRYDETTSESEVTRENEVRNRIRKYEKSIEILPKTPGIATEIEEESIVVSFAEDIYLEFRPQNSNFITPYKLISFNGKEIQQNDEIEFRNRIYSIQFGEFEGGQKRLITEEKTEFQPSNQQPILMYEFKSELDEEKDREVIKGRKVN